MADVPTSTLQQILGYVSLLGVIEKVKSGVPNPFPAPMFVSHGKVIGDSGRYTEITGSRQTARINQYGSAARRRVMRAIGSRDVKLISSFEELPIPPLVLQQLRDYDSYEVQSMGRREVVRQTKEFAALFQNFRIATVGLALGRGRLGFDADGNLLPDASYSGAFEQVTFGINANNQNQLNGTIAASWANNNTDIPSHLRALKLLSAKLTGYEIKHVFYGINIPSLITQNEYILDYLARNPAENAEFLNSNEVGTLFGLTWHPVYTAFANDQNDAAFNIWGDNLVTFTPEISADWFDIIEGSSLVPTSINVVTDALAALNNLKQVWGMYGYGLTSHNPPGIVEYMGDLFFPAIKIPDAVFQATVVF